MSLILHIETAVENASVCISQDGKVLSFAENKNQKEHAAWLHPAIQTITKDAGIALQNLKTVAASNGPGSYTGLRVGLATAKGLCYSLNIPLVTLSTLEIMATAALQQSNNQTIEPSNYLCPLIDARRMEVFTAVYDKNLETVLKPCATVIDENSFCEVLAKNTVLFFGNGAEKIKTVLKHPNAVFATVDFNATDMIGLAEKKILTEEYADIAYAEPFYIKDFHSTQPKK